MSQVLVVEPDKVLARSYKTALEKAGYQVRITSDAQQAINACDQLLPDLVVVEIQLVSHSGIEFLYEIRSYAEWQKTLVIILSLVPQQEFSDNWQLLSKELNIASYLYKPNTTLEGLTNEVAKVLKK